MASYDLEILKSNVNVNIPKNDNISELFDLAEIYSIPRKINRSDFINNYLDKFNQNETTEILSYYFDNNSPDFYELSSNISQKEIDGIYKILFQYDIINYNEISDFFDNINDCATITDIIKKLGWNIIAKNNNFILNVDNLIKFGHKFLSLEEHLFYKINKIFFSKLYLKFVISGSYINWIYNISNSSGSYSECINWYFRNNSFFERRIIPITDKISRIITNEDKIYDSEKTIDFCQFYKLSEYIINNYDNIYLNSDHDIVILSKNGKEFYYDWKNEVVDEKSYDFISL